MRCENCHRPIPKANIDPDMYNCVHCDYIGVTIPESRVSLKTMIIILTWTAIALLLLILSGIIHP